MLPLSLLLIANLVIKSTRSIQSGTTVTKKSMQTIVTNAGGVEPAESSTIAGSAKGYSTRGAHVKTQDHCDTDMNSNLALAAWLAAKRTRQTFQFPHVPCQRRHLLLDAPAAPALEWIKTCMFPWQLVEFDRRIDEKKKTFVCKIGPALSLATNKNRFGVRNLPCGGFLVYLQWQRNFL